MTPPAAGTTAPAVVEAAGCVVVRRSRGGQPQVLLVHRPATARHDRDWSWPKGKLEEGEPHPVAAVRETLEETGCRVRLARPLPHLRYRTADGRRKRVRYWLAFTAPGETAHTPSPDEVDEVRWCSGEEARELLTYPHDVRVLDAALAAARVRTWPLVVLRHAKAVPRDRWDGGRDADRPLLDRGHEQAHALAPLLGCFDVRDAVTSPWARCVQTLLPAADAASWRVRGEEALSEDGFDEDPAGTGAVLDGLLAAGRGAVLCSHRPVLPVLQERLAGLAQDADDRARLLGKLAKGEFAVAHVSGRGAEARVVAVERHQPVAGR
ncbi:NUDIX hydrolase [Kineococcus sp. SYSU DK018]|uniref:NUDIX hydrolase n=1 Tax=Kineococcus sp. SYSU DK018 TaxID=3383139 RepID=UPI003D7DC8D2